MYQRYSKDFESETRVDAQNSKLTRLRKNFKIAFLKYIKYIYINDLSEDVQGCPGVSRGVQGCPGVSFKSDALCRLMTGLRRGAEPG